MSVKKAIVIIGPPKSGKDLVGTLASAYLNGRHPWKPRHTKFTADYLDNQCRAFGLPFGHAHYLNEYGDKCVPEFFGYSPRLTFDVMIDAVEERFGDAFFGRIQARIIKRETQSNVFIYSETPKPKALLALATELGPENVLVLEMLRPGHYWLPEDEPIPFNDPNTNLALAQCKKRNINNNDDKETLRIWVQGVVKLFLGIEDDG